MDVKSKQRIIGSLVLVALLAILMPIVFRKPTPKPNMQLSTTIPTPPVIATAQIQVKAVQPEVQNVQTAQAPVLAAKSHDAAVKPVEKIQKIQKIQTVQEVEKISKVEAVKQAEKAPPITAWVIQLAAFGDARNATRLVKQLRKKGFNAYIRGSKNTKGHHLSRVYVGPDIERQTLIKLQHKIDQSFHLKGVIRRYKA